jgi:hypothetical protein
MEAKDQHSNTENCFKQRMFGKYGPTISDNVLAPLLGFGSALTLRRAVGKGALPIKLFQLGSTRTHFAMTEEVAGLIWSAWIASETKLIENFSNNPVKSAAKQHE